MGGVVRNPRVTGGPAGGPPKVPAKSSTQLLKRAAELIREAAEGLESAGVDADQEREWLRDYEMNRGRS